MSIARERDLGSICVRPAKVCDAPAVSSFVSVARHAGGTLEHARRAGATAHAACLLANRSQCQQLAELGCLVRAWVAVLDGSIVGFSAGVESSTCFRIDELIVARSHRCGGIGASLLRQTLDLCEFSLVRRVPVYALVRGSDIDGLSWLCERGFEPARFANGRVVIDNATFEAEGVDGIVLALRDENGVSVRIAN